MKYSIQEALRDLRNSKKGLKEDYALSPEKVNIFKSDYFLGIYNLYLDGEEILETDEYAEDLDTLRHFVEQDLKSINYLPEPYKQFVIENIKNERISFHINCEEDNDADAYDDNDYDDYDPEEAEFDSEWEVDDDGNYYPRDDWFGWGNHYFNCYGEYSFLYVIKQLKLNFNFPNYKTPLKLNKKQYNEILDNLNHIWVENWNKHIAKN